jgi:RNA polymerase sigma factor (sigma-70 family)
MKVVKEKMTAEEVDKRIVALIKSDSSKSKDEGFVMLFKKYRQMVYILLNKALRFDEETTKDLLMDVFTKVHLNIDSYEQSKAALSTWIYNITKNVLIDYSRKQKFRNTLSLDIFSDKDSSKDDEKIQRFQIEDKSLSNDLSDLLIREERINSLLVAMNLLKREEHKQVLTLFYLHEKSYKEISDEMEVSNDMVKVLLHRAKMSLKAILDKQGFRF